TAQILEQGQREDCRSENGCECDERTAHDDGQDAHCKCNPAQRVDQEVDSIPEPVRIANLASHVIADTGLSLAIGQLPRTDKGVVLAGGLVPVVVGLLLRLMLRLRGVLVVSIRIRSGHRAWEPLKRAPELLALIDLALDQRLALRDL